MGKGENTEILVTNSSDETEKAGFNFAKKLQIGDVICLYGNLGNGKTTFIKGLAKGLGIKHRIISPTFIIVRSYDLKLGNISSCNYCHSRESGNLCRWIPDQARLAKSKRVGDDKIIFYHADLYRLSSENDLESIGLQDILDEENKILAIEWPEKLGKFMPKNRWEIYFKVLDNDKREIKIKYE